MEDITTLRQRKSAYERQIEKLRGKIAKCEEAYDSLVTFRNNVRTTHSSFDEINNGKLLKLEDLRALAPTCRSADVYLAGSAQTLDWVGTKVVGVALGGLDFMIGAKLTEYRLKINGYEAQINVTQASVGVVQGLIEEALELIDGD